MDRKTWNMIMGALLSFSVAFGMYSIQQGKSRQVKLEERIMVLERNQLTKNDVEEAVDNSLTKWELRMIQAGMLKPCKSASK